MRTKWEILEARRTKAKEEWMRISREMVGLEKTPSSAVCSSCGAVLETEAAFDRHFLIPDEQYLNLGNCPARMNDGVLMPRLTSWTIGDAYEENAARDLEKALTHNRELERRYEYRA